MSGQLTSKIKIPKSQIELINLIFAELEITFHNQFHKAFPDEETLNLAKQLWLAKLEKYQNEMVFRACLLYTSPSPRDTMSSRMPSSA